MLLMAQSGEFLFSSVALDLFFLPIAEVQKDFSLNYNCILKLYYFFSKYFNFIL